MASTSEFVDGIGVNTHVDAAAYADLGWVANALSYLGLSLIRDHAYSEDLAAYQTLAAAGTRLDLIVDSDPVGSVAAMAPLGPSVVSFEGANEPDYYPTAGVTDTVGRANAEQTLLYNTVKAAAAFSALPVLNQSVSTPNNFARYANTLNHSNVANVHSYAAFGLPPNFQIQPVVAVEDPGAAKPVEITETGYYTLPTDLSGVDEVVQAKYSLDTLLDSFQIGVADTFLYELIDEAADPSGVDSEDHYGLFNADGSPKLAATAIHDLTNILSAAGVSGAPALPIAPTLTGLPDSGQWLTLSGANNSQFVAVWAEPEIWDQNTHQEIAAASTPVTLDLGATAASVAVFDPMLGSAPIATYANVASVTLDITDHPLLVEASAAAPQAAAAPVSTPAPSVATAPSAAAPIDVFRFFDTTHGTHFYTDAASEQAHIVATRPDLVYEGIGFGSVNPAGADPNAVAVYRFFESGFGTHFYTDSAAERDSLIAARPDLVFEGIGFYEHTAQQPGDVAVYRLFDTGDGTHFYTADANERASVLAASARYTDEGVAFYTPPTS